jgi:hypothetical protein
MHLVDPLGPRSLLRIAKDLGGIHAQVTSAGVLQCVVRAPGLTPTAIEQALWKKRSLVKAWAMRGTLHWIAADDFPIWAAALSTRLGWTKAQERFWKREYKIVPKDVEPAIDAIVDVLDGQCLTRAELADAVHGKIRNKAIDERIRSGWGEVLKMVSIRGLLCFGPNKGRNVTFARADQWLKGWKKLETETAIKEVFKRYLAAHGPATREEFARWWGFMPANARRVIESSTKDIAPVNRAGAQAYILKKDLKLLQAAKEDSEVRALGMFDAYTLSGLPFDEVVPKAKKNSVYRAGAWVSQVILLGGRVVGVWSHETKKGTQIEVKVFKKGLPPKAAVTRAFEPLAGVLGDASIKVS